MQIIQTIRDKGAVIVMVVISLSLIGFILMDSNQQGGGLFSSNTTDVGKVNGQNIEFNDFDKKIRTAELMEEQRSGQKVSGARTYQVREETWNQMVAEIIFEKEASKLGIDFTAKELSYILLSNEPNNPLLQEQQLRDPETGKLNVAEAQKALANIKKFKGEQKENINEQVINPLKLTTLVSKYSGLLNAGVYYPKWMQQKDADESGNFSHISFVSIPYSEISDSAVKVTDADINEYVKKNKKMFKQDAGVMVSYVSISQLPNSADSLKTQNMVMELKAPFAADSNASLFITKNTSVIDFEDQYIPAAKLNQTNLPELLSSPYGTVVGPYLQGNDYVIAKVIGTKMLPDSTTAKHILISPRDLQSGQDLMSDEAAKNLADSLLGAINNGANFSELAAKYSSDGSKDKGGDLGTFGYGAMVPEFNNFAFTNPAGTRGVVRTQFGYHVIEVTNQKEFNPAYKIAYLAKEIMPSDATINTASMNADRASSHKETKTLAEYASKNGLPFTKNPTIVKENDFRIGALEDARQLVQWANNAKVGEVSEPFSIGNNYVVATVDKILKEGTQDAETARSGAEPIILNEKKAELIIKKTGDNPTLEAAATAYNKQIMEAGQDSSLTMASQIVNGIGIEPKLIGASFNKEYLTKNSPAFGGTLGVYVVKIISIQAK
ncbi:MAG: peptidylprolyl isomerase, partial [Ferruginibacter sp.]